MLPEILSRDLGGESNPAEVTSLKKQQKGLTR